MYNNVSVEISKAGKGMEHAERGPSGSSLSEGGSLAETWREGVKLCDASEEEWVQRP